MAQIDSNLVSCFLCCRAAVKAMRRQKAAASSMSRRGRRWNGAAAPAWPPIPSSKAGVAALTMALAEEVAKDGILVNAVAPSIMDTPANRKAMPKADHAAWPKVEEVAATILFLASPDNKVTRGAIVPVYGKRDSYAQPATGTSSSGGRSSGSRRSTPPRCGLRHRPRGSSRCRRDRRGSSPSARATARCPFSEVSASQLMRSSRAPLPRWKRATASTGMPRRFVRAQEIPRGRAHQRLLQRARALRELPPARLVESVKRGAVLRRQRDRVLGLALALRANRQSPAPATASRRS